MQEATGSVLVLAASVALVPGGHVVVTGHPSMCVGAHVDVGGHPSMDVCDAEASCGAAEQIGLMPVQQIVGPGQLVCGAVKAHCGAWIVGAWPAFWFSMVVWSCFW